MRPENVFLYIYIYIYAYVAGFCRLQCARRCSTRKHTFPIISWRRAHIILHRTRSACSLVAYVERNINSFFSRFSSRCPLLNHKLSSCSRQRQRHCACMNLLRTDRSVQFGCREIVIPVD